MVPIVVGLLGLVLVVVGLALVYLPLALVAAGGLLIRLALYLEARPPAPERDS